MNEIMWMLWCDDVLMLVVWINYMAELWYQHVAGFINLVECEILRQEGWIDGWDFSNNETGCDLEVNTSEEGKIERDDACLLTRLSYFLSVGNLLLPPLSSPLSLLLLIMMMMSVALSPDLLQCYHHWILQPPSHFYECYPLWDEHILK